MNIDRLTEIAVWLEAGAPEKNGVVEFDMTGFIEDASKHPCGTACCIAGAAIQFSRAKPFVSYSDGLLSDDLDDGYQETAERLLGIDQEIGESLFFGNHQVDLEDITPAWAARCIRKLIATGEVDWVGTRYA